MSDQDKGVILSETDRSEIRKRVGFAAEVFQRHGDEIRAFIHFNVKDKSTADDLFQELFVSIVHKPIPSSIQDIKAYMYRAVTNDVIDSTRQRKNHQDHIQNYAYCQKNDSIQEDPQKIAIRVEGTKKMFQFIENRLTKREAQVVLRRFGHGFNTTDTAKQMHVNKKVVSQYLSVALKKIRQFISEDEEETI